MELSRRRRCRCRYSIAVMKNVYIELGVAVSVLRSFVIYISQAGRVNVCQPRRKNVNRDMYEAGNYVRMIDATNYER